MGEPAIVSTIQVKVEDRPAIKAMTNLGKVADAIASKKRDLKFNTKNLSLGNITGDVQKFGESLAASNARVLAFGASTGVIVGLQQAFKGLVNNIVEVEHSLANINVILQASSAQFEKFGKSLFEVANNTGSTFSAAAEAASEFARQGLSLNDTLAATEAAMILVRISGGDATSAVETLTAAANTFNSVGLKQIDIVNKLANVDAAFATSADGLGQGLKRVGSVASDAGVDIDQLLGLIAALQQRTARGEAVIGNGLKTIFARVQRTSVLDQLEDLGLSVRDAAGESKGAISILTQLSKVYNDLSSAQRSQVSESVAGVFQLNTLKALLGDLGSSTSFYSQALKISANSTDEATQRNAKLNETLSTLFTQLGNNIAQLSSSLGDAGFADPIRNLIGFLGTAASSFNNLLTSVNDTGAAMQGIVKGFSTLIQGPGLVALAAILGKLFINVGASIAGAASVFLNLNKEGKVFNSLLQQGVIELTDQEGKEKSILQIQKEINKFLKEEVNHRRDIKKLSREIAPGIKTTGRQANRVLQTAASGYSPVDIGILKESVAIGNGVGGARSSAKPYVANLNLGNGKKPAVVNTDEKIIKNFGGTGKDAVLNRDMLKQIGTNRASGFAPNLASGDFKGFNRNAGFTSGAGFTNLGDVFEDFDKQARESARKAAKFAREAAIAGLKENEKRESLLKKIDQQETERKSKKIEDSVKKELSSQKEKARILGDIEKSQFQRRRAKATQDLKLFNDDFKGKLVNELSEKAGQESFRKTNAIELKRKSFRHENISPPTPPARFRDINTKEIGNSLKAAFSERKLLATGFALPFAGEAAIGGLRNSGRIKDETANVLSAGVSGVSTTALAASQFGVLGAAGGALIGTLGVLDAKVKNAGVTFDKLTEKSEDLKAQNVQNINAGNSFIQLNEKLKKAILSGASAGDIAKISNEQRTAAFEIGDKDLLRKLSGSSSVEDQQGILFDFQKDAKKKESLFDASVDFRSLEDQANSVSGRIIDKFSAGFGNVYENIGRGERPDGALGGAPGGKFIADFLNGFNGENGNFDKSGALKLNETQLEKTASNLLKSFDPAELKQGGVDKVISDLANGRGSLISNLEKLKINLPDDFQSKLSNIANPKQLSLAIANAFEQKNITNRLANNQVVDAKNSFNTAKAFKTIFDNIALGNQVKTDEENASFDIGSNRAKNFLQEKSIFGSSRSLEQASFQLKNEEIERSRIKSLDALNQQFLSSLTDIIPSSGEKQKELLQLVQGLGQNGDGFDFSKKVIDLFSTKDEEGNSLNGDVENQLKKINGSLISELSKTRISYERESAIARDNFNSLANQRQNESSKNFLEGLEGNRGKVFNQFSEDRLNSTTGLQNRKALKDSLSKRSFFGSNSNEFKGANASIESAEFKKARKTIANIEKLKGLELLPEDQSSQKALRTDATKAFESILNQQTKGIFGGSISAEVSNLINELSSNAPALSNRVSRITGKDSFQTAVNEGDTKTIKEVFDSLDFKSLSKGLSNGGDVLEIIQEIQKVISQYDLLKTNNKNKAGVKAEALLGPIVNSLPGGTGSLNAIGNQRNSSLINGSSNVTSSAIQAQIAAGTANIKDALNNTSDKREQLLSERGELIKKIDKIDQGKTFPAGSPAFNIRKRGRDDLSNTVDAINVELERLSKITEKQTKKYEENVASLLNTNAPTSSSVASAPNQTEAVTQTNTASVEANTQALVKASESFNKIENIVQEINVAANVSFETSSLQSAIQSAGPQIANILIPIIKEKITEAFRETIDKKARFTPTNR